MKGLNSIEAALEAFASGMTKASRATETHQIQAISQDRGALGLAYYMIGAPHLQNTGNSFVKDHIMKDAKTALRSQRRWSRHFDYDGQGSFFKTGIEIEALDRRLDLYSLGIYAAYVGDKPEEGLAEYLGVPRMLIWASVEFETESLPSGRFEFDFETIVRKLDSILATQKISGQQIAEAMMQKDQYGDSKANFRLYSNGLVSVTMQPGSVENRFDYGKRNGAGEPTDTWSIQGSLFRGLLRESYEIRNTLVPPTVLITVRNSLMDSYNSSIPIWDPNHKEQVLNLRDQIASAIAQ